MEENEKKPEGGSLDPNAPADGQVNEPITEENKDTQDKDLQSKKMFDNGYRQGRQKERQELLTELGFESVDKLKETLKTLNDQITNVTKEKETTQTTWEQRFAELEKKLAEQESQAKQLEKEKTVGELKTKLQDEYGFNLPASYKFDGENAEEVEKNARAAYDELKAWREEQGIRTTPKAVGTTTKPSAPTQMTKEEFRKLTPTQKTALFKENPDLFAQLTK